MCSSAPSHSEVVSCLTSCHHGHFRFKDGEVSGTGPGRTLACEDRKHFLFVPEASGSDVGLNEVQAENHRDAQQPAGNSCSGGDDWLVVEVFDIISEDWYTWFGTLCFLLWLLYLIVL